MRATRSCVYCNEQGTTSDHVIPRCLLERPFPPNLPTVPSCLRCNKGYSGDEEYFLAVMAQSGLTPFLTQKVEEGGHVDRMLERAIGLDTHFLKSLRVDNNGRVYIVPDQARLARVTQKMAFGFYLQRYRPLIIPTLQSFHALPTVHYPGVNNPIFMMAHTPRFNPRRWTHVQPVPPTGKTKTQVFDYMFVRNRVRPDFGKLFCIMRFHETMWAAVRCPTPSARRTRVGINAPHAAPEALTLQ